MRQLRHLTKLILRCRFAHTKLFGGGVFVEPADPTSKH
jgi:hypothetical protein